MAVDTREKRASAIGHFYTALPLPNSAISAADREQVSWVYMGIGFASVTWLGFDARPVASSLDDARPVASSLDDARAAVTGLDDARLR